MKEFLVTILVVTVLILVVKARPKPCGVGPLGLTYCGQRWEDYFNFDYNYNGYGRAVRGESSYRRGDNRGRSIVDDRSYGKRTRSNSGYEGRGYGRNVYDRSYPGGIYESGRNGGYTNNGDSYGGSSERGAHYGQGLNRGSSNSESSFGSRNYGGGIYGDATINRYAKYRVPIYRAGRYDGSSNSGGRWFGDVSNGRFATARESSNRGSPYGERVFNSGRFGGGIYGDSIYGETSSRGDSYGENNNDRGTTYRGGLFGGNRYDGSIYSGESHESGIYKGASYDETAHIGANYGGDKNSAGATYEENSNGEKSFGESINGDTYTDDSYEERNNGGGSRGKGIYEGASYEKTNDLDDSLKLDTMGGPAGDINGNYYIYEGNGNKRVSDSNGTNGGAVFEADNNREYRKVGSIFGSDSSYSRSSYSIHDLSNKNGEILEANHEATTYGEGNNEGDDKKGVYEKGSGDEYEENNMRRVGNQNGGSSNNDVDQGGNEQISNKVKNQVYDY